MKKLNLYTDVKISTQVFVHNDNKNLRNMTQNTTSVAYNCYCCWRIHHFIVIIIIIMAIFEPDSNYHKEKN